METTFWIFWIQLLSCYALCCKALNCGYPGSPMHGRPNRVKELYDEGETVNYTCDAGYFLLGPPNRRCQSTGLWSGRLPLCDTSLASPGTAEVSQSLSEYPAALAIDGNVATCSITTRRAPRWWRLDLGRSYTILSVGITINAPSPDQNFAVFILGLSGNSAIYQRCASFSGKFASSSIILVCGEGSGLVGRYIHIEDNRKDLLYFGLCEVEVMVVKDRYDCGQPERPTHSYTVRLKAEQVEYRCLSGYKLLGNRRRQCLTNGQWSETQPLCIEVKCNHLPEFSEGRVKVTKLTIGPQPNQPVLGSVAKYFCNEGHMMFGNGTRECLDNGYWSGQEPICQPVNCGQPPILSKIATYKLVNSSTAYGSLAELSCISDHQVVGDSVHIRCRSDGAWSKPKAKCSSLVSAMEAAIGSTDVESSGSGVSIGLIVGMIGAVVVATVVLIYFVLRRRTRQKLDRHSISSTRDHDTTTTASSSGAGSCQSLVGNNGIAFHNNEGFYSEPKTHPVPISLISNGHYDYPRPRAYIQAPTYAFTTIPSVVGAGKGSRTKTRSSSHKSGSGSSKENIYEEITIGSGKKTGSSESSSGEVTELPLDKPISVKTEKGSELSVGALYARVDFKKKREGRLQRQRMAPDGASDSANSSIHNSPENGARNETISQPSSLVTYRELPPIPIEEEDDDHLTDARTARQLANLRRTNFNQTIVAPITEHSVENELYGSSDIVMVDNDLYAGN